MNREIMSNRDVEFLVCCARIGAIEEISLCNEPGQGGSVNYYIEYIASNDDGGSFRSEYELPGGYPDCVALVQDVRSAFKAYNGGAFIECLVEACVGVPENDHDANLVN